MYYAVRDNREILALKILVLDGGNQNTLAIVRRLGAMHDIDVVGYNRAGIALYSRFKRRKYILTDPKKNGVLFLEQVIDLLKKTKYDLLMPVGFKSYQVCSEHQNEIRKWASLIVTTRD